MNWLDTFRNSSNTKAMAAALHQTNLPPLRFMEVCGTHTVAIAKHAIRQLMPGSITLTSGPGCPVCVTPASEIDLFIQTATRPGTMLATFGDLIRVPGSDSSLMQEMARGREVRVVYSPLDAVELARSHPDREVVFLGVGFETTAPTVAAAILMAREQGLGNFSVLSAHKVMPPALRLLADDPEIRIDGLLCPGHVSVIIGADAYTFLAEEFSMPCVVAGFEPADILQTILLLARQVQEGRPRVEIGYQRAVNRQGNLKAQAVLAQVFEPTDAEWRGLGIIAGSGLDLRAEFQEYDARRRFGLQPKPRREIGGCQCGRILKGQISPPDCKLFGTACQPASPVGPCMVSSEGACAAYYRYRR